MYSLPPSFYIRSPGVFPKARERIPIPYRRASLFVVLVYSLKLARILDGMALWAMPSSILARTESLSRMRLLQAALGIPYRRASPEIQ